MSILNREELDDIVTRIRKIEDQLEAAQNRPGEDQDERRRVLHRLQKKLQDARNYAITRTMNIR